MATILTSSQQTFVDITDQRKLSAYITSNLPKTQSENPNVLPIAYTTSDCISDQQFEALGDTQKMTALSRYTVVEERPWREESLP